MTDFELIEAGFMPGMPGSVIGPFDKVDSFDDRQDQPDDVWEESDGIRTRYQAQTLLISEPLLWTPLVDWRLSGHEMSRCELAEMSNFEVDAIYTLANAHHRKMFPKKGDDGQ